VALTVRPARRADDGALLAIDVATWSPDASPGPQPASRGAFFCLGLEPEDVLVAEVDREIAGYAALGHPTRLQSNRHVLELHGLAVAPAHRRRGIARVLLEAAAEESVRRGARRLRLRVLAPNEPARRLYAGAGFVVEGVLREEFRLAGRYVDDVLMALDLVARLRS
jgi:ribosomal protein S18 acetylase RimI-like enzyme